MGWGKSLWESMPQGEAHSLPEGPPGKLVTDQHLCPVLSPTMFLLPGWSWSWPVTSRYAFPPRPGWDSLPPHPQPPYPSAPFPQPGNPALTWTPACPGPCPLERPPPALPSLAPAHLRPFPVTPPVWTTLGSKKLQQYQFHRLLNPGPTLIPHLTAGSEG